MQDNQRKIEKKEQGRQYGDPVRGPSDRIRTCGILLPKVSGEFFALICSGLQSFPLGFAYSLALLKPLFPRAPPPAVVINVVKNASRPEPALVTGPGREAFLS